MWYKKLDYKVDVEKIREEFLKVSSRYDPIIQGEEYGSSFGGWSILSHTGKWSDGMVSGREAFNDDGSIDYVKALKLNIEHEYNYNVKTEICTDYTEKVIDELISMHYNPTRARFTILKAGGESTIHTDVRKTGDYSARIHIPIITNEKCTHSIFEGDKKIDELHMPADGSVYILWTNNFHQIKNESNEDRIHLMMSVWSEIDDEFKYNASIMKLKVMAAAFTSTLNYTRIKNKNSLVEILSKRS